MELHGDEVDDRLGSWMALLHARLYAVEDRAFLFVNIAACKIMNGQKSRVTTHCECSKIPFRGGNPVARCRGERERGVKVNKCSINSFFVAVSKIHVVIIEGSKTRFRLILEQQGLAHGSFFVSLPINWFLPDC